MGFMMQIRPEVLKKLRSGNIVIDSVLQKAYQGTTLMNDHMNGEFPVLKPGANAISWTGTVTKVVVRPNWRYL